MELTAPGDEMEQRAASPGHLRTVIINLLHTIFRDFATTGSQKRGKDTKLDLQPRAKIVEAKTKV
jgi:hypothetical protein